MKNTDFSAFCREQRKIETDSHKQAALCEVYAYMRECGVTKAGVNGFIGYLLDRGQDEQVLAALEWLQGIFNGK